MMGIIVPDLEMPCNCLECIFKVPIIEVPIDIYTYKKASHCRFAPDNIEDPWRDLQWMLNNKEVYCPLKPYTEQECKSDNSDIEDGILIPQGEFAVEGFNCCISSYNDKEFILRILDVYIPYHLSPKVLDIFMKKYGQGVRVRYDSVGADSCIVSIPTKNIVERGGLL